MKQQELLDHWKDIVMAVLCAENAIVKRGEKLNKDALNKEQEIDRWVTLVAHEILTKQNDLIMDYKDKYEKALERARKYKEKGYMMINAALDNIFPEQENIKPIKD